MNLKNNYFCFQNALSHKFCNEIIKYAKTFYKPEIAVVGSFEKKDITNKKNLKNLKKYRNSKIVWLNDRWIFKEIIPFVLKANKEAGWNFSIHGPEQLQFTEYGINQYYHWHQDSWNEPYNKPHEPFLHNKNRKLSITYSLSDPSDYQGGELEFDLSNSEKNKKEKIKKCTEVFPRGSLVVFPSFVWHRVCPVTTGTRYSLVTWFVGEPFK